ncbi:MAG: family 1 encapsulin nanocompartment shell protein [Actinoallomurus sp.]
MNNLHRELAPMSAAAWTDLESEARRTFERNIAGRRLIDVPEAAGIELAAVPTGHLDPVDAPCDGVLAHLRRSKPVVELEVSFTVDRRQVDDVERGARDPDWQPVKDAVRRMAFAEDRAVFEGYPAAGITGLRASSSNASIALPADPRDYPEAISQGLSALRLVGVDGPYALALSADAYTAVSETSDHGYPILEHLVRLLKGDIVWAPAIEGAFLLSTRGGDYTLRLGQDLSIGYRSHDAETIELYLRETFTFLVHTAEAAVALTDQ